MNETKKPACLDWGCPLQLIAYEQKSRRGCSVFVDYRNCSVSSSFMFVCSTFQVFAADEKERNPSDFVNGGIVCIVLFCLERIIIFLLFIISRKFTA